MRVRKFILERMDHKFDPVACPLENLMDLEERDRE